MTITRSRLTQPSTTTKLWCWAIMPPSRRLELPDDCRRIKLDAVDGATIGMAIATGAYPNGRRWFRFHIANTSGGRDTAELIRTEVLDSANVYTSRGSYRLTSIVISPNAGPIDIGPNEKAINRRNARSRLAELDH